MFKSFAMQVWPLLVLGGAVFAANIVEDSPSACDFSPVEIVFLVDVTAANRTNFKVQQQRLLRTLKHLDTAAGQRRHRFSVISFHSNPTTLLELGSPFSNDTQRLSTVIATLRPRHYVQTSVAKAFDAAVFQFKQYGDPNAKRVVLLAHDGVSTDRVAETVEAATSIKDLGVQVFALSGNPLSNSLALLGYTGERERLLINADDTQEFHAMLDDAIGVCGKSRVISRKAKGVRIGRAELKPKLFDPNQDCGHGKLDLMIVLDTSGSVFTVFEDQRKIALDILESYPQAAYDDRLQVSVVRFASTAEIIVPFLRGRSKSQITEEVKAVRFTGENTRIASAIDMAIEEIERARRKDATQVFILISDGHGQEYWNVVQTTGKRLQETGAENFAVSAGHNYNEAELLIYIGHRSRLFVGPKYTSFLPTIINYIAGCVGAPLKGAESGTLEETKISTIENDNKRLEASSKFEGRLKLPADFETHVGSTIGSNSASTLESVTTTQPPVTVEQISEETTSTLEESTAAETNSSEGNNFGVIWNHNQPASAITVDPGVSRPRSESLPANAVTSTSDSSHTGDIDEASTTATFAEEEGFSKFFAQSTSMEITSENDEASSTPSSSSTTGSDNIDGSGIEPKRSESQSIEGSGELESNGSSTGTSFDNISIDPEFLPTSSISPRSDEVEVNAAEKATEHLKLRDAGQFGALPCDIDLVLILDRSTSVVDDFEREINTALQIVNLFSDNDYSTSRIRVGAVSFAKDARLELALTKHERKEVSETIEKIEHTGGSTSAVEGAKLAMARLLSNRRSSARLIILLLTDGHSQDYWRHLVETSMKLRESPNSILLAFTASNYFSRSELQAWTGDKKRVFLNNEEDLFLNAMKDNIRKCKGAEEFDEKTGELESVAKKEGTDDETMNQKLSLAAILTTPEAVESAIESESTMIPERPENLETTTAKDISQITTVENVETTGNADQQTTADSSTITENQEDRQPTTSDDVPAETTEAIQTTGALDDEPVDKRDDVNGENSVRTAEGLELSKIESTTIGEASEIQTTGESTTAEETQTATESLKTTEEVVATTESAEKEPAETSTISETSETMDEVENTTVGEKPEKREGLEITNKGETPADEKLVKDIIATTVAPERGSTEEPKAHGIKTADGISDKDSSSLVEKASVVGGPCLVDLIFVIDISTSVETEFQRQLQFAVDLVKRLPTEDFENRVKVGVVLFNFNATLYMPLGKISSRSSILDALLSIENTGGSTSVASGIAMAVNEIERRKRPGARQMVVLVSDGNSQDLWDHVILNSNRLRNTGADVYAVTVSQKYMFRELELYAGDKWRVYIDARIRQFLDEAEHSLMQCGKGNVKNVEKEELSSIQEGPSCESDPVDIILAIDTTTTEARFFEERQFAEDLIKSLPKYLFEKRLALGIIPFSDTAEIASQLGSTVTRADIIYELERIQNTQKAVTANYSSLVEEISEELSSRRRTNARVIVVLVTDGGMKQDLSDVQNAFESLGQNGAEVFAVATAEDPNMVALEAIVPDEKKRFAANRLDRFVQEVGAAVIKCVESREELPKQVIKPIAKVTRETGSKLVKLRDPESDNRIQLGTEDDFKNCKYKKMDLQIILDASSSREEVFEQQRELALSIIERLPISADGTHVAVGINSFTSVPTLRQTLGLGREKKIVRSAIEGISYTGGSTLTAQAVELSVEDLVRGRRKDALQVVILMNDGISQDTWERVQEASEKLEKTGAERFGVALGEQVDLRELNLYIGNPDRIYRDGNTEKLLSDIIDLLQKNCSNVDPNDISNLPNPILREEPPADCAHPNLDLVVLFDNTDKSGNMSDPIVNANRYLLLDVLGSLANSSHVRVSVISFSKKPKVELDFTNISERDLIFAQVEAIKAVAGMPSYAEAMKLGLDLVDRKRRTDAKATMIIVGDGTTKDSREETTLLAKRIRDTPRLSCLAVDSSPRTDIRTLKTFTGRREHVFDYERNALFAEEVKRMARKPNLDNCPQLAILDVGKRALAAATTVVRVDGEESVPQEQTYSVIDRIPLKTEVDSVLDEVKRDLTGLDLDTSKFDDDKVIVPKKELALEKETEAPTTKRPTTLATEPITTTPRPTTPTIAPRNIRVRVQTTTTTEATETEPTASTPSTTTPSFVPLFKPRPTPDPPIDAPTTFKPGCLLDVIMVLDSSGSVEETFRREKELAAGIIDLFRIGPDNARIALIKFAAPQKVKTIWSLSDTQSRLRILRTLQHVPFSSGTTAIHSAILRAISEYREEKGARPGRALPIAILFTDGFGQRSAEEEASLLRKLIPHTYAVAINHQYPISRKELIRITGDEKRVYTDANIKEFHDVLKSLTSDCVLDD